MTDFGMRSTRRGLPDARRKMVAETSAFLTWAMRHRGDLPRIPRRRVDEGGFSQLLALPGARERIGHWWECVLDRVERSAG